MSCSKLFNLTIPDIGVPLPDGFFARYVQHFYAAAKSAPPVDKIVLFDNYHLQKNEPPGRNPLAAKNKNLFDALEVGGKFSYLK